MSDGSAPQLILNAKRLIPELLGIILRDVLPVLRIHPVDECSKVVASWIEAIILEMPQHILKGRGQTVLDSMVNLGVHNDVDEILNPLLCGWDSKVRTGER